MGTVVTLGRYESDERVHTNSIWSDDAPIKTIRMILRTIATEREVNKLCEGSHPESSHKEPRVETLAGWRRRENPTKYLMLWRDGKWWIRCGGSCSYGLGDGVLVQAVFIIASTTH